MVLTVMELELAKVADIRCCHEVAAHALALAATELAEVANECCHHEAAKLALTNKCCHHEAAELALALVGMTLSTGRHHHLAATPSMVWEAMALMGWRRRRRMSTPDGLPARTTSPLH